MPKVLVSADYVFPRTVEVLGSGLVMEVSPPVPRVVYRSDIGLDARPCIMWEVERPQFVIDEVPY